MTRSVSVLHERLRALVPNLPVARHTLASSYDRTKDFGDWASQGGGCDTRAVSVVRLGAVTEFLHPKPPWLAHTSPRDRLRRLRPWWVTSDEHGRVPTLLLEGCGDVDGLQNPEGAARADLIAAASRGRAVRQQPPEPPHDRVLIPWLGCIALR